jgi:hypothetical protein
MKKAHEDMAAGIMKTGEDMVAAAKKEQDLVREAQKAAQPKEAQEKAAAEAAAEVQKMREAQLMQSALVKAAKWSGNGVAYVNEMSTSLFQVAVIVRSRAAAAQAAADAAKTDSTKAAAAANAAASAAEAAANFNRIASIVSRNLGERATSKHFC